MVEDHWTAKYWLLKPVLRQVSDVAIRDIWKGHIDSECGEGVSSRRELNVFEFLICPFELYLLSDNSSSGWISELAVCLIF